MNSLTPTQTKEYIQNLLYKHLDWIDPTDTDYIIFVQNKIIGLGIQPRREDGRCMKYPKIWHNVHISIQPKLWRRYQAFLLKEWADEWNPIEVRDRLDKMIKHSYNKIGVLYRRVNKHYEKISQYKNSINNK